MQRSVVITLETPLRARIDGLRDSESKHLYQELSYQAVETRHVHKPGARSKWDGRKPFFYKRTQRFAAPLLKRVKRLLKEASIAFTIVDRRKPAPQPNIQLLKPDMLVGMRMDGAYAYQLRAVRKAAECGMGVLRMATNSGKSAIACAIVKLYLGSCEHILFLTHKQNLALDIRKSFAEQLGTIEENIGLVGMGRFDVKKVTIAMVNSLLRRKGSTARNAKIKQLLRETDMVIVDEAHHLKSKLHAKPVNACVNAAVRFGLSGSYTPGGEGLCVEAAVGPVIFKKTNAALVKLGVSAKPVVEMVEVSEPEELNGSWPEVYRLGIVDNVYRNNLIIADLAQCAAAKRPAVVLVREKRHGRNLSDQLRARKIPHKFLYSTGFPGGLPAIKGFMRSFEQGYLPVLVATTGLLDEGANLPACRDLLIADGMKSLRSVLQRVGRALRKKKGTDNTVRIVDYADLTNGWLAEHAQERLRIYTEEGFEIQER